MNWNGISTEQWEIVRGHMEQVPVRVSALAKDLGLTVKVATLKPGISGEIRPDANSPSGYKIRINRHEAKNRQRFTAAHEIAHFLLHRNLIGNGLEDTVLYRSRLSNSIEAQANGLAANLLMPRDIVQNEIRENADLDEEQMVDLLAAKFHVSPAAMRIRLGVE